MADLSAYNFTGRLTKDAQVKTLPSGKIVTEFDVANNVGYGDYAKTNWLKVKMWGDRGANIAQIFKKGSLVAGSGTLSTDEYDDKNGVHRTNIVVTVLDLQILASKKADSNAASDQPDESDTVF